MFIRGLGTATPPARFSQAECREALARCEPVRALQPRSRRLLDAVLAADNGLAHRHLALDSLEEAFDLTPDALHRRFGRHAPALAAQAARRALADAGLDARDVGGVVVSTCTGYLCPGLSNHLIERLNLPRDIPAFDLVGQGCGAALPNWQVCQGLLSDPSRAAVLSVCVEICSAALFLDDDPGTLISACLFGDGAGAAVLGRNPGPSPRPLECIALTSRHVPEQREALRFETRGGMLRNRLTRDVPALAAREANALLHPILDQHSLEPKDLQEWILHGGGRDVLRALQDQWQLPEDRLRWSAGVLRDFGNISSPFVLFALERARRESNRPGWWWMTSFGAGFSVHGALLRAGSIPHP